MHPRPPRANPKQIMSCHWQWCGCGGNLATGNSYVRPYSLTMEPQLTKPLAPAPAAAAAVVADLDAAEHALLSLLDTAGHTAAALAAADAREVDSRQRQFLQQAQLARDLMKRTVEALKGGK